MNLNAFGNISRCTQQFVGMGPMVCEGQIDRTVWAGGGQCPRPGRLDMDVPSFIMLSRGHGSCQQKYQQSNKISQ